MKKNSLLIICHMIIFISTLVLAFYGFKYGAGGGQVGNAIIGWNYFTPFTIESNLLSGISSFFILIYLFKNKPIPKKVLSLHLVAASSLFLTFLTVLVFLAPMDFFNGKSYFLYFKNDMFFFHFLNPLLSIFSFIYLEREQTYLKKERILGMLPTLIYTILYFTMVVIVKKWEDIYNFTFGGHYFLIPVVLLIMISTIYGLSTLLIYLHNKNVLEKKKN